MAFFDRFFGKGRVAQQARAAELRGDFTRAVELYAEAEQPDEAARIMLIRADAETDARARLQHLAHAARLAREGSDTNKPSAMRPVSRIIFGPFAPVQIGIRCAGAGPVSAPLML